MSHEVQNEKLHDYLEGVLTTEDRHEFERHLETCQLCREEIHMVRRLDEVVATLPEPELPPRFMEKLQAALDEVDANPAVKGVSASAPTVVAGRVPARRFPRLAGLAVAVWLVEAETSPMVDRVAEGSVQLLAVGATVETPGSAILRAGESSEARLTADSTVRLGSQGFELIRGRVFVAERGEKLRVETPQAIIVPTGTDYDVTVEGERTTVRVWEGQVSVEPRAGGSSSVVTAGTQLTVPGGTPGPAAPDAFVQWNRNLNRSLKPRPAPSTGNPLPKPPVSDTGEPKRPSRSAGEGGGTQTPLSGSIAANPPVEAPRFSRHGTLAPGAYPTAMSQTSRPALVVSPQQPGSPAYPVRRVPPPAWRGGPPAGQPSDNWVPRQERTGYRSPQAGYQETGPDWRRSPGAGGDRAYDQRNPGNPGGSSPLDSPTHRPHAGQPGGRGPAADPGYPNGRDPAAGPRGYPTADTPDSVRTSGLPRSEGRYPGVNSGDYGPSGYRQGSWTPPSR